MYNVSILRFFDLNPDGSVVLGRSFRHRRRRQGKICHAYDPKRMKLRDKRMRHARQKRQF